MVLKDYGAAAAQEARRERDTTAVGRSGGDNDRGSTQGRPSRRRKTGRGTSPDRVGSSPHAGHPLPEPANKRTRGEGHGGEGAPAGKGPPRAWDESGESSGAEGNLRGDSNPAGRPPGKQDWDSSSAGSDDHCPPTSDGGGASSKDDPDVPPHGEAVRYHTHDLKKLLFNLDFKFGALNATVNRLVTREIKLTLELAAVTERGIQKEASLGIVISKLRGRLQALERGGGRGAVGVGRAGPCYVTHPELKAKNYASFTEVQEEISAEVLQAGLPSRLAPRLNDLKAVAFGAGGSFNLLLGRLMDLECLIKSRR